MAHFNSIGLNHFEISIALLFGPLCGAFIQPLFGTWSDQCQSRWGRRKPFIIGGTVLLNASLLSLAWAESIARIIDAAAVPNTYHTWLITVVMTATLSLWVAVQAVQIGLRTLITDGCSPSEQASANAWASAYSNLAATMANLAAYVDLLPQSWDSDAQGFTVFMKMSLAATLMLTATVTISCLTVKEQKFLPPQHATWKRSSHTTAVRVIMRLLLEPSQIRTIYFVQFFAWLAWFPLLYYMVSYVKEVYATERRDQLKFQTSVQIDSKIGSLSLLAFSAVGLVGAIGQPQLHKVSESISIRRMWIVSQGILGLCLLSTLIISSSTGTIALFSVVGFSWASSSWIPFALLGVEISCYNPSPIEAANLIQTLDEMDGEKQGEGEDEDSVGEDISGLVYGLHNFAICLPQMLMSLAIGIQSLISQSTDEADEKVNTVYVLRIGGCFALIAMYLARGIKDA